MILNCEAARVPAPVHSNIICNAIKTRNMGRQKTYQIPECSMHCNQKKGDKLLSQIGWKLLGPPPKVYPSGFVC